MAIGTSDGEYYPSSLEHVLAGLTTQGDSRSKEPKNNGMDFFRDMNDENQFPGNPPLSPVLPGINDKGKSDQDPNLKIRRVENTDIRTLFPHMPDDEVKAWEQSPPREYQHKYKGDSNILDIPGTLDSKGHEDGVFVDQLHPDLLKLNQDEYDIRFVPKHEIFHIQRRVKPPLVGDADLPANAQPAQYLVGLSNQDAADKDMKLSSEEKNLYDTHLKNLIGTGGVDNEDGSRSSLKALTVSGTGDNADKTYIVPTVVDGKLLEPKEAVARADKIGLDKFPAYSSQEEADKRYAQLHDYMEKDTQNYQSIRNTYNKVTDFLDNLSDMKGAENWSPREIIGHAIATGMNALGFGGVKVPTGRGNPSNQAFMDTQLTGKTGFGKFTGEEVRPVANENIKMSLREQLDKAGIKSMSADEYKQYQADRKLNPSESDKELAKIQEAAAEWAKDHPPTSSYERALENQKAGKMNPAGDTADEFIKSLRRGEKPNLTLVEKPEPATADEMANYNERGQHHGERGTYDIKALTDKTPPQEPQGRPIPGEQARTQEAQRAANDRNYQMGKGSERVNVGPGKGVLNDNKEEVQAMIRKGHKPSEIAKRFDITPLAVRSWIKNHGPITNIDDILK